jgi:cytochrome P450/deferrochelatase/peroxidase EfeB
LQLILRDPAQMPQLMMAVAAKRDATYASLQELHFVHFARFLPSHDNSALQVITSFDGPLDAYALDFVIAIGDIFDAILSFVKDAPPLPVREHPKAFYEFVETYNRVIVAPPALMWDDYPAYSAYPNRTVIDILGPRRTPPPVRLVEPSEVDLTDVQGNILAGYRAKCARHYSLRLQDGQLARALLEKLVDGDGLQLPKITSAQPWQARPAYMLNVAFSAQGLTALGLPADQLTNFSNAFLQGAGYADRASANGDTGASSPEFWEIGGARTEVHLMLSLFANSDVARTEFDVRHDQLLKAFDAHRLELVHQHDAQAMPDGKVHFGFVDGIAQPHLAGVDKPKVGASRDSDLQPMASVGEFLLGSQYTSVYGGTSLGQLPAALCQNATFVAVRVLDQDVAAFESALDETAKTEWADREWVAAKMMGRWRDGRPLLPPPSAPATSGHSFGNNAFDYAPSLAYPDLPNDHAGNGCPVGSHLRRMNPRSSLVAGQPYSRRLIRRGMPYGPAWSESNPDARRGLFGLFICGDLERQFEFLMQQWANSDFAASGIKGTQDPIIGSQTLSGTFNIPMPAGQADITVKTPRWITTRGSLYLLMPGLNSLRWLAKGVGFDNEAAKTMGAAQWLSEPPAVQTQSRLAPAMFDPMDPDFLSNPYPYYGVFRQHAPVALVKRGDYQSYWVFSHELCQQAALEPGIYLKQTTTTPLTGRGLFFMDDPLHAQARTALDPQFMQAITGVGASTNAKALQALMSMPCSQTKSIEQPFDLVLDYANPVLRNVFMEMFGWPAAQWTTLGDLVEVMLQAFNPMLPLDQRTPSYAAAGQIMQMLQAGASQCPHAAPAATGDPMGLFCRMWGMVGTPAMSPAETLSSALDFLLGGYLSSVFLASTGINNLLKHPEAQATYQNGDAALRANAFEEMKRFDAPFQLADRYAAQDVTLGGILIPQNSLISLVYGSANHDQAAFGKTSEMFDIERTANPSKNLVFGVGEHRCIGAPMAGITVPIVIDTFLEKCPKMIAMPGAAVGRGDPYFRGFSKLPLTAP